MVGCLLINNLMIRIIIIEFIVLDTYEQGLIIIRHLDDTLLEEYAIMKWREVSREFKAKQSQRQPWSVLLRVMEWFRSFFN